MLFHEGYFTCPLASKMISWLWLIIPSRSNRHAHSTAQPSSDGCWCRDRWPV